MQRYFARKGDKTTANGDILEGDDGFTQDGIPVAFHGAKVYCPACNSTGVILTVPPFRPFTIHGKQIALGGDLCICKCNPPPKLIVSQTSGHMSFESPDSTATSRTEAHEDDGMAVTGLAHTARTSADDDYERMKQAAYGDSRFWTAQVGQVAVNTKADTLEPMSPDASEASHLNIDQAVNHLNSNAYSESHGECAKHIRMALTAGGLILRSHPAQAKRYGSTLESNGFNKLDSENYTPQKGDITVIQDYPGGNPAGHIAMYNGTQWVSDFKQRDMWSGPGYRTNKPSYAIYRPDNQR